MIINLKIRFLMVKKEKYYWSYREVFKEVKDSKWMIDLKMTFK